MARSFYFTLCVICAKKRYLFHILSDKLECLISLPLAKMVFEFCHNFKINRCRFMISSSLY